LLRRHGPIAPSCYFGGPGYPTPEHPNYFGGTGPLVPDQTVVTVDDEPGSVGNYGEFTESIPDAEAKFAPITTISVPGGSSGGTSRPTPANPAYTALGVNDVPGPLSLGRTLGIDGESVSGIGGARGVKFIRVYPGSHAEKSGLQAGGTIESANGYLTEQPTNLVWTIANAAPGKVLRMNVRAGNSGEVRTITARLP
jgi:hypothetical protein